MPFDGLLEFLRGSPNFIPLLLFCLAFGKALVFTSPLLPGALLLIGIAGVHARVGGSFAAIFLPAACGNLIGDLATFLIAGSKRETIGTLWPLAKYPDVLPRAVSFIDRWGVLGLIASKFLGPVRWIGPIVCGIGIMPTTRFVATTVVASLLWAAVVLAPPFYGINAAFR